MKSKKTVTRAENAVVLKLGKAQRATLGGKRAVRRHLEHSDGVKAMIRHKQFMTGTGRSGAAKYFTEHLSVSAYYANGVGLLQGQAFEHVGMQFREVDLAVFSALEAKPES